MPFIKLICDYDIFVRIPLNYALDKVIKQLGQPSVECFVTIFCHSNNHQYSDRVTHERPKSFNFAPNSCRKPSPCHKTLRVRHPFKMDACEAWLAFSFGCRHIFEGAGRIEKGIIELYRIAGHIQTRRMCSRFILINASDHE